MPPSKRAKVVSNEGRLDAGGHESQTSLPERTDAMDTDQPTSPPLPLPPPASAEPLPAQPVTVPVVVADVPTEPSPAVPVNDSTNTATKSADEIEPDVGGTSASEARNSDGMDIEFPKHSKATLKKMAKANIYIVEEIRDKRITPEVCMLRTAWTHSS